MTGLIRPDRVRRSGMARPGRSRRNGKGGFTAGLPADLALLLIGASFALPLLWLIFASLDTAADFQTHVPATVSLANFAAVLTPELLWLPLWNSLLLAFGAGALSLLAAVLAAYPLSRFDSKFNRPFLYTILCGTCLPITALMVPVYGLFVQFRLLDSLLATTVFMAATSLPMAIWMTKNFMDAVPLALEEAAWMDGADGLTALRTIVLPLMRPGLGVVFIFVFIQSWGNFFVPFILLLSPGKQPAAVSIFSFFGQYGAVAYGELAAFSVLYSLPVLALYAVVTRLSGGASALSGAMRG